MGRGMSMEEFRAGLASEARDENEKLKKELEEVKKSSSKKIKELTEELEESKTLCTQLANRCFVSTRGGMCMHCNIDIGVCRYQYTPEEEEKAGKYMRKNKLNMDSIEDFEKVRLYMEELRNKRLYPHHYNNREKN